MELKQFLDDNPIIKKAELARLMWPDKRNTNTKLANKLAETAGQRVTEEDKALALKALKQLVSKILQL